MSVSRNQHRKPCFDLSKFYQDLNRVENSIGRTRSRESNSSLNKNNNIKVQKEDRLLNLAAFKKNISGNSKLIKGKIHLQQLNDKTKINKTENLQKDHVNRVFRMSEVQKDDQEDQFQYVRTKLLSWKHQQLESTKDKNQSNDCLYQNTVNNSRNEDYKNYFDQNNFEYNTTIGKYQINSEQTLESTQINNQLLKQLTSRNQIYRIVQKQLKVKKSLQKKQNRQLSIKIKHHFRENSKMVEIIQRFKDICGIQINNLHQLYDLLCGNSRQLEDPSFISTTKSIGITEKKILQK